MKLMPFSFSGQAWKWSFLSWQQDKAGQTEKSMTFLRLNKELSFQGKSPPITIWKDRHIQTAAAEICLPGAEDVREPYIGRNTEMAI